jgi:hypothetical protein
MSSSRLNGNADEALPTQLEYDLRTEADWPNASRYTTRSPALVLKVFRIYQCRQSLYTDLCATEVARLLQAVNEGYITGPRERAKYLNPMRDLFTDSELLQMQNDLAKMEDHRVVIWGPDLAEFLQRVPYAGVTPDGKRLELWITEVSTKSSNRFAEDGFERCFSAKDWVRNDHVKDGKYGPRIEIPGEWSYSRDDSFGNRDRVGRGWAMVTGRRRERAADVQLHLRHAHTISRDETSVDFAWMMSEWQVSPPEHTLNPWEPFEPMRPQIRNHAYVSGDQCPQTHFSYMTTTDMKTLRIKTATEGYLYKRSRTCSASAQREHMSVIYNVDVNVTNPNEGGQGTQHMGYYFIFKLEDCSYDNNSRERCFGIFD